MFKTMTLVLVLAAAACGGSKKDEATTPPTTTQPQALPVEGATTTLALGEMKLWDVNKNKALIIHADGTIELEGTKAAKVTADGKIVKIDTGEVGFTLEADGSVKGPQGVDTGAKITADGTLTTGDKTITIGDDGMLAGGNASAPPLKIEGASDVNLKRTALFVLVALLGSADPAASSTTGPS